MVVPGPLRKAVRMQFKAGITECRKAVLRNKAEVRFVPGCVKVIEARLDAGTLTVMFLPRIPDAVVRGHISIPIPIAIPIAIGIIDCREGMLADVVPEPEMVARETGRPGNQKKADECNKIILYMKRRASSV